MQRAFRVGLIVPSSNTTMETEIPAMLGRRPETFTFHSSRARLHNVTPEELAAMVDDGERCAAEVADASVDVVGYACLIALMAQGHGFHEVAEARLRRALDENGSSAPVVSSAGALIEAARALGAERISVVAPYMKPMTEVVVGYIEAAGITVIDSHSLEVANNLSVGRIDPFSLLDALDTLDVDGADAVVLSLCVQCPSLPAIPAAEQRLGLPVLSASVATTFQLLRALGLPAVVPDAGALLSGTHPAVQAATSATAH